MAKAMCWNCLRQRSQLFRITQTLLSIRQTEVQTSKCMYAVEARTRRKSTTVIEVAYRSLKLTTGNMAKLATGSAEAQYGDTSVLAAVVSTGKPGPPGMVPMSVDYRQKAYAVGRIPTNYLRRDIGMSDTEILTSRLIDRSLRPLFEKEGSFETQIVCNLVASDRKNDADVIAINAASMALASSNVPWKGPVGAVKIGIIDGKLVVNPTLQEQKQSALNLVLAATEHNIVMIEAAADVIPSTQFIKAVKKGFLEAKQIAIAIKESANSNSNSSKRFSPPVKKYPENVENAVTSMVETSLEEILTDYTLDKRARDRAIRSLTYDLFSELTTKFPSEPVETFEKIYWKFVGHKFRQLILTTDKRCDGRSMDDLRSISCEVDKYKPLHGSSLFQRGHTQVLCTVTFDSLQSAANVDMVSQVTRGIQKKSFFVHYEFPSFAVNELTKIGASGNRRSCGHGALAEKGLIPVIPQDYPFTIRLTSEVLESNGSSSMATICGGSLALMDAGVPISAPVAGVAMGLVTEPDFNNINPKTDSYKVLTDLLGIEDYYGDMDFKISGTATGVTALQMDLKIQGIPLSIIEEAVLNGTNAYKKILDIMAKTQKNPNPERKADVGPLIKKFDVPLARRNRLFGLGASNVRRIQRQTGAYITEIDDYSFEVFAPNPEAMKEVETLMSSVEEKTVEKELLYGAIYTCKILELQSSGLLVQLPSINRPVLMPNSQADMRKVKHSDALGLEVGEEIQVQYLGRDQVTGGHRLSRKVLQLPTSNIQNKMKPGG